MAGASLLALLDDIVSVLDDVALLTKVAVKKTTGVLGDDLALNAQQVSGVRSERELPVVWGVAKGSLVNKLILIPMALALSALAPWAITPLLMFGGVYLCYEGAEKLAHRFFPRHSEMPSAAPPELFAESADLAAWEKNRIKGAIRTDFVLSAEIVVISLGTIPPETPLLTRAGVLSLIGLVMTVGVYGLVGGIVKLDDLGLRLLGPDGNGSWPRLGACLLRAAPMLMRLLTVVGTAAMFLVGGGILAHGLPFFHPVTAALTGIPAGGLWSTLVNAALGLLAGGAALTMMGGLPRLLKTIRRGR